MGNNVVEWMGIGVGVSMGLLSVVKLFGYDARRLDETEKGLMKTSSDIENHIAECSKRREEFGTLKQKVDSAIENQARMETTVNRMDTKLDRLIEKL